MGEQSRVIIARLLYNNETCYIKEPEFSVQRGDLIVVETSNGPEIACVSGMSSLIPEGAEIRNILRRCTDEDMRKREEQQKKIEEAWPITLEKIRKHNLDMKLVSIHYFLDDSKIIFNFTADGRVDFRELVKDLASVFRKRIELRQIGARDEAKIIRGLGICGRDFCCNAIKHELQPVTIKMAKDQNLTLNSSKISGACGRLLCCLAYEHEAYQEFKKNYPQEGSVFQYEDKKVTLTEINIIKKMATLKTEDGVNISVPLDKLPREVEQIKTEQEVVMELSPQQEPDVAESGIVESDVAESEVTESGIAESGIAESGVTEEAY
jgi:cell fate regulator YaaT (PSP1 superfamily)